VGLADQCDHVVFVEADEPIRRRRVLRDRGWTPQEFVRLEKTQAPLDAKRRRADCTVVNNAGMDELRRQVEEVFARILAGG